MPAAAATVAVVGAGPAGLSAATSYAERGFAVTLFEKDDEIGGQFRLAHADPRQGGVRRDDALLHAGASRCWASSSGSAPRSTWTSSTAYDEVVVATGVEPRIPEIPGIERAISYADVLNGTAVPGRRVAVIGAGGIGVDVSVWLTHTEEDLEDWLAHWGVGDPA